MRVVGEGVVGCCGWSTRADLGYRLAEGDWRTLVSYETMAWSHLIRSFLF